MASGVTRGGDDEGDDNDDGDDDDDENYDDDVNPIPFSLVI